MRWHATLLLTFAGLVAGTAGLAVALDATGRLWRSRPGATRLVPAGVLIVLALPPFWEFATSGLETGLTVGWTGVCWWLLVRAALARPGPRWAVGAAVVLGVGPLVRPDLAVVGHWPATWRDVRAAHPFHERLS